MEVAPWMHCDHSRAHHAIKLHRHSEGLRILVRFHTVITSPTQSRPRPSFSSSFKSNPTRSLPFTPHHSIECPATGPTAATHPAGAVQPYRARTLPTRTTTIAAETAISSVTVLTSPKFNPSQQPNRHVPGGLGRRFGNLFTRSDRPLYGGPGGYGIGGGRSLRNQIYYGGDLGGGGMRGAGGRRYPNDSSQWDWSMQYLYR